MGKWDEEERERDERNRRIRSGEGMRRKTSSDLTQEERDHLKEIIFQIRHADDMQKIKDSKAEAQRCEYNMTNFVTNPKEMREYLRKKKSSKSKLKRKSKRKGCGCK
jgi:hypothetical protein